MKLRLKPTVIPYRLSEQVVLQFNGQYAKLPDPDGAIWLLTSALDGTRDAEGLIGHVLSQKPAAQESALRNAVKDFIEHRLVEVPEESLPSALDAEDRTRFSRNLDFFGSMAAFGDNKYAFQEKLQDARVCVLGCGGLGTHILFDLAALGIRHLTILDFDKIELSNLNRQILYKESDIGSEKVETAKKRLLEFNSRMEIRTHRLRLQSTEDVAGVVRGHDIVICVADKPANYIGDWLNAACVRHGIPFISGGLDVRRSVFFSVDPGISGCEACWLTSARSKNGTVRRISAMSKEQDITYERPAPAFVTLVAVTAGMIVSEAVKYLTGCQRPQLTGKLKEFSFDDLSVGIAETWERDPDCQVCGGAVQHRHGIGEPVMMSAR
ncbi:HesA/MoeB/ThiF family protein [Noviherbaspirillum aerium]|uniref:HesA/MoeB/ThiF family protein n=1 Tax=Noviherbaspirillum aerium TaxID=2588497 RepID=UPI00124CC649|nr:ThiF family adenylyltransferase [Noviherbaspirillum aerium]